MNSLPIYLTKKCRSLQVPGWLVHLEMKAGAVDRMMLSEQLQPEGGGADRSNVTRRHWGTSERFSAEKWSGQV